MTISPNVIIPENLLYGYHLADVMDLITRLHVNGETKVELLKGWAQTVGVRLSASQFNTVRNTGTDCFGPVT